MPFPGLDHPCVEKAPDQVQNTPIADLGRDLAHQLILVDLVKESTDVGIQDPEVAFVDLLPHLPHRHVGRAPRPIPERAVGKVRLEDGSHLLNQRLLNHPVRDRGDSELSDPAVRLRDTDPLHRSGSVAPVAQLPVQRGQAFLLPVGEGVDGEAVDAGPALVRSDVSPGFGQICRSIDLVDQRMDFPLSWVLRFPSVSGRLAGLLDAGAGSFALRTCPHFRHVLTRASLVDAATQHGAFPLRSVVWIRPASPLVRQRSGAFCPDPVPEYLAPIRLLASLRSELRLRLYPPLPSGASGRALRSPFLALSSASVALFRPYLPDGRYQASLGYWRSSPPCRPHTPWCDGEEPMCLRPHSAGSTIPRLWPTGSSAGIAPVDYDPVVLLKPFGPRLAAGALPSRRSSMVAPGQPIRVPAFAVVPH